jgi:hypothetical protein
MEKYDFVIHGASGFTGQFVVEYVYRAAQEHGKAQKRCIISVADPGCSFPSRIPDPTFWNPDSSIPDPSIPDLGSQIRIKEFKYFNPKKWFLSSMKYDPGC